MFERLPCLLQLRKVEELGVDEVAAVRLVGGPPIAEVEAAMEAAVEKVGPNGHIMVAMTPEKVRAPLRMHVSKLPSACSTSCQLPATGRFSSVFFQLLLPWSAAACHGCDERTPGWHLNMS